MSKEAAEERVYLDGAILHHERGTHRCEVNLSSICLIGETTTESGPFGPDHFVCFADAEGGREYPTGAEGMDVVLATLEKKLGMRPFGALSHITTFASVVLWPPELAGNPIFEYLPNLPRNRLLAMLVRMVGGPYSNTQRFTPEVAEYLTNAKPVRWEC